jgi:hypothetical protein
MLRVQIMVLFMVISSVSTGRRDQLLSQGVRLGFQEKDRLRDVEVNLSATSNNPAPGHETISGKRLKPSEQRLANSKSV